MIRCVYCLDEVPKTEITKDHVIARSWFPKDTPLDIAKWKAPSCRKCNNEYSSQEADVLNTIGFCLDPNDSNIAHICQKSLDSIDVRKMKNARDFKHRFNKREAMRARTQHIDRISKKNMMPSFKHNLEKGSTMGINISSKNLDSVIRKWAVGVHYCEFGAFVPNEAEISVHHVSDEVAKDAYKNITENANIFKKGPSVTVHVWRAFQDNKEMSHYGFNLYGQFKAFVTMEIDHGEASA